MDQKKTLILQLVFKVMALVVACWLLVGEPRNSFIYMIVIGCAITVVMTIRKLWKHHNSL
jgi:hypothetical protein